MYKFHTGVFELPIITLTQISWCIYPIHPFYQVPYSLTYTSKCRSLTADSRTSTSFKFLAHAYHRPISLGKTTSIRWYVSRFPIVGFNCDFAQRQGDNEFIVTKCPLLCAMFLPKQYVSSTKCATSYQHFCLSSCFTLDCFLEFYSLVHIK